MQVERESDAAENKRLADHLASLIAEKEKINKEIAETEPRLKLVEEKLKSSAKARAQLYHQSTILNKEINPLAQQRTTLEGDLATAQHGLLIAKNSWKELKTPFLESKVPPVATTPSPQPTIEPIEVAPKLNVLVPEPATDTPISTDTIIAAVVDDLSTIKASKIVEGITATEGIEETGVGAAEGEITTEGQVTTEDVAVINSTDVETTIPSDALVEGQTEAVQVPNPSPSAEPAN